MVKKSMIEGAPTKDENFTRRYADFETLVDALEYAASGCRGLNFYSARGELDVHASYTEIRDRAKSIGQRLVTLGLKPGDRMALIAETSLDFVCYFLATQYASVLPVPMPLPTSFGGRDSYIQQLERQLLSCGASAVITPDNMKEMVVEAAKSGNYLFVGSDADFNALNLDLSVPVLPKTDDVAYLQYSSGSTRFPHGIAITHKSLLSNCGGIGKIGMNLSDDDRCVSWLPFYHDMGLVGTFLTPLTCQVTVDYLATENFARRPLTWLNLMSRNKGTVSYSPTFGYDICARRVGKDALAKLDLSSWRVAGIGGDMIRPDVMHHFEEVFADAGFKPQAFVPSYGLAETTLAVSFMPLGTGIVTDKVDERILNGELTLEIANQSHSVNGNGANGHANGHSNGHSNGAANGHIFSTAANDEDGMRYRDVVNCGVPLPEFELEIRSDDGQLLPDRAIGKVFVRGQSVMTGYYNDPETTDAVLSKDGWLDTGDMGYMLDGSLYIIGRIKDMIIVNGRNHWPQDIEWAAEQLPGLRNGDIAAVSLPGEGAEEVPAVLVHCRQRDPEERKQFADDIKAKIQQETGVQVRIELVPPRTLPRTSSGKLSRSKARQQFLNGGMMSLLAV